MVNKRNTLGRGLGSLLNTKEDSNNDKLFDEIDIEHSLKYCNGNLIFD